MRIAKWTLLIVGALLLLLVATAFVLTNVVDPNRYRGKIEGIVADLAGRPFVIEGNIAITWYPWLGLRTGAAHLDNSPGIPGPPLVEWQSITVAAKVWPLLHGQIEADRIRLQSPTIHLRRDAQGHGNWEGLGATQAGTAAGKPMGGEPGAAQTGRPTAPGGTAPGTTTARGTETGRGASRPLQIAGVEIRDGTIDYVDEATGQHATLSNLELDIGEWRASQPLPVHTRFLAHTTSLPPAGVWVQLDAPQLAIRPSPLNVTAPKMTLKVANAQWDGDVSYEQTSDAQVPDASGTRVSPSAPVNPGVAGSPSAPVNPGADGSPSAQVNPGVAVNPSAHGSPGAHLLAHGSAVLRTPSLRKLANDLALNQTLPHDPTTLGPLELTTTWRYEDGSIEAKPLALKLDEVSFNGWLHRSAAPEALWAFELHGDRIDLGRYVNLDSANKKPFELPVEALRAINANGSLIFDQVVLADTHLADVRLKLQTPEGKQ